MAAAERPLCVYLLYVLALFLSPTPQVLVRASAACRGEAVVKVSLAIIWVSAKLPLLVERQAP